MGNTATVSKGGSVHRRTAEKESVGKIVLRAAIGAAVGVLTAIVLLIPVSLLISGELLPRETLSAAVKAIVFISGAMAAFTAGYKTESFILPRCVLAAVFMFLIMLVAGLVFIREPANGRSIVPGLFGLAGAAAGAIIKSMPKKRRRP